MRLPTSGERGDWSGHRHPGSTFTAQCGENDQNQSREKRTKTRALSVTYGPRWLAVLAARPAPLALDSFLSNTGEACPCWQ